MTQFRFSLLFRLFLINIAGAVLATEENAPIKLAKLNVDADSISVSGFSMGGVMATQLHVAHSKTIKGAGLFAGDAYACSYDGLIAKGMCTLTPWLIPTTTLTGRAKEWAKNDRIDPVENLASKKVLIYTHKSDILSPPSLAELAKRFYEEFKSDVKLVIREGVHGFPSKDFGGPCDKLSIPHFINNCNYSGAFESLNYLYPEPPLKSPTEGTDSKTLALTQFDQTEVSGPSEDTSMDSVGFIYVPSSGCTDKCKLHVHLHGCAQSREFLKDGYVRKSGFLEVAELNNIVILFPQVGKGGKNNVKGGCWDNDKASGEDYATRKGTHMMAVFKMIERVTKGN